MVSYNAGMLMIVIALITIIVVVVIICYQSSNDIVYTTPAAIAWPILIAVAFAAWGCSSVRDEMIKCHPVELSLHPAKKNKKKQHKRGKHPAGHAAGHLLVKDHRGAAW